MGQKAQNPQWLLTNPKMKIENTIEFSKIYTSLMYRSSTSIFPLYSKNTYLIRVMYTSGSYNLFFFTCSISFAFALNICLYIFPVAILGNGPKTIDFGAQYASIFDRLNFIISSARRCWYYMNPNICS